MKIEPFGAGGQTLEAAEVMRREGVAINDLHAPIRGIMKEFLDTDLLHLSSIGSRVCAEAIARAIEAHLT